MTRWPSASQPNPPLGSYVDHVADKPHALVGTVVGMLGRADAETRTRDAPRGDQAGRTGCWLAPRVSEAWGSELTPRQRRTAMGATYNRTTVTSITGCLASRIDGRRGGGYDPLRHLRRARPGL